MKIKAKRLSNTAIIPTYGSKCACASDIYCDLRVDKCIELNPDADFKHMEVNTDHFEQDICQSTRNSKNPYRMGIPARTRVYATVATAFWIS